MAHGMLIFTASSIRDTLDFYDPGETAGADALVKCPVATCPAADLAGVAGWFNAKHDTAAAIAGAFGAKYVGE